MWSVFESLLTLIGLGEIKVDLADFDLKLQENLLSILFYFFFFTYSCRNVFRIFFWTSDITSKNDVLTSIITYFCQKSCRSVPCRTSPLPPGFSAYTDDPSSEEVPPARGMQSHAAPVNIQPVSGTGPCRVWGKAGSQLGPLSHSFLVDSRRGTNLGNFLKPEASIAWWHIIHATLFIDRALSI